MKKLNLETQLSFDDFNNPYFQVNIKHKIVKPYLSFLQNVLTIETYEHYTKKQLKRDKGKHHITIINPKEYLKVDKKSIMLNYPISVNLLGIGHVKEPNNEVYFIVCESKELNNIRSYFALAPTNFHITLGFKESDIFDKPKNRSSLIFPYKQIEDNV